MNYKESIYKEEEQQFVASEPVMATYVSTVPKIMNAEELKADRLNDLSAHRKKY